MKNNFPIFLIIGAIILGGLFFILKPKNELERPQSNLSPKEKPVELSVTKKEDLSNVFTLVIKQKKLISGPTTIKVDQGEEVTINVTSDEAEEFHLHAYDNSVELEPNKQVALTFTAELSGRFPFELEHSKTEIGALEVQPK